MVTSTWHEDREALVKLVELYQDSFRPQTKNDLAKALQISPEDAGKRMLRLASAAEPFGLFSDASTYEGREVIFREPTERAYREVGQWPSLDSVREAFIDQLSEAIASEPDSNKKAGLKRLLDAFQGVAVGTANTILGRALGV